VVRDQELEEMAEQPGGPVADLTFRTVAVGDPLKPVTRQQRLYLLAVSMIGIAIVRTGLVPSKIATFGIELNKPNRSALLFLLALVTIYFLASFIIYAASDYLTRREALAAAREREEARARYQEVAIALSTSEENLRREYAQKSTGDFHNYVSNRFRTLLGEKDRSEYSEQLTRRTIEFLEGLNEQPPPRVLKDQSKDPSELMYTMYFVEPVGIIASTRLFFEFFLPPIVGLYAIYTLLFRAFVIPEIVALIATFGLIGVIAGIVATLLFPESDPGGIIVSVLIGIAGAFVGGFIVQGLFGGQGITQINLGSILAATVGAIILLAIYRLITRRVFLI
jgi:uncharacterized membrane protein YeaQ/YmgE (transglycosylase-associated protein family)